MTARLQTLYEKEIIPAMQQEFNYGTRREMPKLVKFSVNMGLGEGATDNKVVDRALEDLALITGQKPVVTRAKKSIAGFKLRAGMPIGCKVTLRQQRMYEFLDRLANIALPRSRDFRGLSKKSFDKKGNFNLGLKEQIVFPEIDYDQVDAVRGLDIAIVTTAKTDAEAQFLLSRFNLPFKN